MLDSLRAKLSTRGAQAALLSLLFVAGLVLRIQWILAKGDTDGDSYGHWGIACSVLVEPTRLDFHWVWPPGYHFWLAFLLLLHTPFLGVRLVNAVLAAAAPVVVYLFCRARRTFEPVAWTTAVLLALSPLAFLSGTSAQQETLFAFLILLVAWALDQGQSLAGGLALGAAVLVRYEAIGALGLLLAQSFVTRLWPRLRERLGSPTPFSAVVPSLVALAAWTLVHRLADGRWFAFFTELYTFTRGQRDGYAHKWFFDLTWFPVRLPLHFWGPLLLLVPFGLRARVDRTVLVPLGVWLFLLASYVGRGVQGNARYYVSLIPFVCLAIALGAHRLQSRIQRPRLRLGLWFGFVATALFLLGSELWYARRVDDHWARREESRAKELAAEAYKRLGW